MKAYVFPGQGAQFAGMGKDLYETNKLARNLFDTADRVLGFSITKVMFEGSDEDLKKTEFTQPSVFLHSVVSALSLGEDFKPDMVAGHSLGEISALVACGALSFEDGLKLVCARAKAMQKCCDSVPGTMAAVIGLKDDIVRELCSQCDGVVVAANFNCPGQVVISGEKSAVEAACVKMKEAGARRALVLAVNGAFHSPLMEPAREELAKAINNAEFHVPMCPVYQNLDAMPHTDPKEIKENLLLQLTSSVRWTDSVRNMIADGATEFIECGPGQVLTGLIAKIR